MIMLKRHHLPMVWFFCLNKYRVPPGTICSQENIANTWEFVERYIKDMLQQVENEIIAYSFISNYK